MNVYVVYCHPDHQSFTAAVQHRTVEVLTAGGHDVRVADLYGEGFDPTLSLQEVRDHLQPAAHQPEIDNYCGDLQWCETLVFVYPTWWSGPPRSPGPTAESG